MVCDEWAIATLVPEVSAEEFHGAISLITNYLEGRGWRINYTSRCGMGTALVQFTTACSRDTAVSLSPFQIGDSVLRISKQDRGLNYRSITFTHDVWILLMNYPLECWDVGVISRTVSPYGRFLIWNKDPRDKARVIVKLRVMNVDNIPISLVVLRNLDDVGYGDSWTCPTYILSRDLIGQQGGDEDPLPPDGGNPHPLPHVHGGFWHDEVLGNIPMDQVVINPHNENLGAPYEDVHVVHNDNVNHDDAHMAAASEHINADHVEAPVLEEVRSPIQIHSNTIYVEPHETLGPDYIPINPVASQPSSQKVPSPVFIPNNCSMSYNDIPSTSSSQPLQTSNIAVEGATEHINVLQELIGNLVTNAQDIIPKLGGSQIVNASCNVVDVVGTNGNNKRCYLQIQTIQKEPPMNTSSVSIEEITGQEFAEVQKPSNRQKKKKIIDDTFCRRSNRIAKLTRGFKDQAAADNVINNEAKIDHSNKQDPKKLKKDISVNLGPQFDAVIINKQAPPPPEFPMKTLQAIGTGPCKMAPQDVSPSALHYDSSDD